MRWLWDGKMALRRRRARSAVRVAVLLDALPLLMVLSLPAGAAARGGCITRIGL